jgi:hypothetical protein
MDGKDEAESARPGADAGDLLLPVSSEVADRESCRGIGAQVFYPRVFQTSGLMKEEIVAAVIPGLLLSGLYIMYTMIPMP